MYCRNCGAQIDENDKFCPYCGNKVVVEVSKATNKRPDYSHNPYEDENNQFIQPDIIEEQKTDIEEEFQNNPSTYQYTNNQISSYDVQAKLSHIFALIGFFTLTFPFCIAALILAKNGIKSETYGYKSRKAKGLAIAGIILFIIVFIIEIAIIVDSGIYY